MPGRRPSRIRRRLIPLVAVSGLLVSFALTAVPPAAAADRSGQLEMYTATVTQAQARGLVRDGYDVSATRSTKAGVEVDLVLAASEVSTLKTKGVNVAVKRNKDGKSARQLAAEQAAGGYVVWRSFDEAGGIRDQMYDIARKNPKIAKLEVIGRSVQGREILALKITRDANTLADGSRPAVLYASTQHAREWISTEVNRRLVRYFVDNYKTDATVKNLVDTRELWFVLVANPDGYQYTFTPDNRLWRKNLRDNDGDNVITPLDGVDPNRNFPEHWNFDDEGSSSTTSSETYRGPSAASEPETQAITGLYDRVDFAFHVNYHSFGELLLYTFGSQVNTPSADDPIYVALSGTDKHPAITGYDPGVGADLYTTNGETTDWAHARGTLAWTPELDEGPNGDGFIFPDSEGAIQAEFNRNLPFARDVAMSAGDPDDPRSSLGNQTQPFYLDVSAIDAQK